MGRKIEVVITKVKKYLKEREDVNKNIKQKDREEVIASLRGLDDIWKKYGVERAYLYGSFADMSFHKSSDIDVAIEPSIKFDELLKIYAEVNNRIKRKVDVRLVEDIPFAEKIRKEGVIVYERKNCYSEKRD